MSETRVTLDVEEAKAQGYAGPAAASVAARRAVRWLSRFSGTGLTAPGHIRQKMDLLRKQPGDSI